MRLLTAHKIFIGSAIALALVFTARSFHQYESTRELSDLVGAGVAALASVGLGVYLGALWRRRGKA